MGQWKLKVNERAEVIRTSSPTEEAARWPVEDDVPVEELARRQGVRPVASAVFRGRVPAPLSRRLTGQSLAVTFVTVAELTKWTLVRHWGPDRCLVRRLPLATLNLKDFTDFAEHEGLHIIADQQ